MSEPDRNDPLKELGELMGTNFTRCEICNLKQRPLLEGEERVGFDIEPFRVASDKDLFVGQLTQFFGPCMICFHDPRVWFRSTPNLRKAVGDALRELVIEHASNPHWRQLNTRFSILADMLLHEGAFHPSKLHKLTDEELAEL
jgi:hypothetical protein